MLDATTVAAILAFLTVLVNQAFNLINARDTRKHELTLKRLELEEEEDDEKPPASKPTKLLPPDSQML